MGRLHASAMGVPIHFSHCRKCLLVMEDGSIALCQSIAIFIDRSLSVSTTTGWVIPTIQHPCCFCTWITFSNYTAHLCSAVKVHAGSAGTEFNFPLVTCLHSKATKGRLSSSKCLLTLIKTLNKLLFILPTRFNWAFIGHLIPAGNLLIAHPATHLPHIRFQCYFTAASNWLLMDGLGTLPTLKCTHLISHSFERPKAPNFSERVEQSGPIYALLTFIWI